MLELLAALVLLGLVVWGIYKLAQSRQPPGPQAQELYQLLNSVSLMSGTQFEFFAARVFQALGYRATVLGGSGDQGVDLILQASDGKIAVQCKNYKKPVGNKPVQEVYAGARHHRCPQAWVVAPAGYTKGAHQLARSVGVRLFDANSIRQWIRQIDEAERETQKQAAPPPTKAQPEIDRENYDKLLANYEEYVKLLRELRGMKARGKVPLGVEGQWRGSWDDLQGSLKRTTDKLDTLESRNPEIAAEERAKRRAALAEMCAELED